MSRGAGTPHFSTLSVKCTNAVLAFGGEAGMPPVAALGAPWRRSTAAAPSNHQCVFFANFVRIDARCTTTAATASPPVRERLAHFSAHENQRLVVPEVKHALYSGTCPALECARRCPCSARSFDDVDARSWWHPLLRALDALKAPLVAHDGLSDVHCAVSVVAHQHFASMNVLSSNLDLHVLCTGNHERAAATAATEPVPAAAAARPPAAAAASVIFLATKCKRTREVDGGGDAHDAALDNDLVSVLCGAQRQHVALVALLCSGHRFEADALNVHGDLGAVAD